MDIKNNLTLSDDEKKQGYESCRICGIGKMIPYYPEKENNHCFVCNHCGANMNIEPADVVVE